MTGFIEAPVIESGGGYPIGKSLRLRAAASASLSRTPATATNRKTWTWSGWAKRGSVSQSMGLFRCTPSTSNQLHEVYFATGGEIMLYFENTSGAAYKSLVYSANRLHRDPSAHYHVVCVWDTTQAVVADRVKFYINGLPVAITVDNLSSGQFPQNYDGFVNSTTAHTAGYVSSGGVYADGYLSEINFIDGQALTPSSFGQFDTNGVWTPKPYSGAYGTNGFYLKFNDGSNLTNLCLDRSGNGNNWTATNVSLTAGVTYDWMDDTPTNNFAVLNPLLRFVTGILDWGNLRYEPSTGAYATLQSSIPIPPSGKYYLGEVYTEFQTDANNGLCYLVMPQGQGTSATFPAAGSWGITSAANSGIVFNGVNSIGGLAPIGGGELIRFAVDVDAGKLWLGRGANWYDGSGGSTGNPVTGANPTFTGSFAGLVFALETSVTNANRWHYPNFGQRPFAYTPPTGFKALCTANLPAVTVPNGRKNFDVATWVGNATARNITGFGFQPDLVWGKSRSDGAANNRLIDSVRGVTKELYSSLTNAETTDVNGLTSFNSDGFGLGVGASLNNNTLNNYVGWLWKAGGAPVTNNNGSISAQVSANPAAGFSIVTYTGNGTAGATIGHGLGVAPKMVITKSRTGSVSWVVGHSGLGTSPWNNFASLNLTNASAAASTIWNNTAPSASVVTLGTDQGVNASTAPYVAYCFAEIAGYSKFGSYTGNGSADGPFVYCGFRPRFVLVKRTDSTGDWFMLDTARNSANTTNNYLLANSSNAEVATIAVDVLASGFKIRVDGTSWPAVNPTGGTVVYAAFAENPFGGNNVAPATAR